MPCPSWYGYLSGSCAREQVRSLSIQLKRHKEVDNNGRATSMQTSSPHTNRPKVLGCSITQTHIIPCHDSIQRGCWLQTMVGSLPDTLHFTTTNTHGTQRWSIFNDAVKALSWTTLQRFGQHCRPDQYTDWSCGRDVRSEARQGGTRIASGVRAKGCLWFMRMMDMMTTVGSMMPVASRCDRHCTPHERKKGSWWPCKGICQDIVTGKTGPRRENCFFCRRRVVNLFCHTQLRHHLNRMMTNQGLPGELRLRFSFCVSEKLFWKD